MAHSTREIVEQYYDAWRSGDVSRFPFSDDFTFDGPMASFSNPTEFRTMAAQFAPMTTGVHVLDAIYGDDRAFVMLEFSTNVPQLGSWIACDYFVVEGGTIKYSRTSYDPRKLVAFVESR